ncbi:hypothetical protein C8R44DRAFT_817007 [Mycena epipterygia]|nr:hypothetical protein C8R44DRAFT_817007 [Mycena epipterygia]
MPSAVFSNVRGRLNLIRSTLVCVAGYRWLFYKVKVMHRDVSLGNLMYHTKNDKIFGVLNDFMR